MACNVTVVQLEIKKIRALFDFNDGECKSGEIGEFMTLQLALLSRIKFCLHIAIAFGEGTLGGSQRPLFGAPTLERWRRTLHTLRLWRSAAA